MPQVGVRAGLVAGGEALFIPQEGQGSPPKEGFEDLPGGPLSGRQRQGSGAFDGTGIGIGPSPEQGPYDFPSGIGALQGVMKGGSPLAIDGPGVRPPEEQGLHAPRPGVGGGPHEEGGPGRVPEIDGNSSIQEQGQGGGGVLGGGEDKGHFDPRGPGAPGV